MPSLKLCLITSPPLLITTNQLSHSAPQTVTHHICLVFRVLAHSGSSGSGIISRILLDNLIKTMCA